MERRNELYLVVLSILLGISVLKLTEIFQLSGQLKSILSGQIKPGLSPAVIGIYLFIGGYIIFFVLVALSCVAIVRQLASGEVQNAQDLGPLVGLCILSLVISYLCVFAVAIYGLAGKAPS